MAVPRGLDKYIFVIKIKINVINGKPRDFLSGCLDPALILLASGMGVAAGNLPAATNELQQFSVRRWQTDEGLPQNEVLAITQTRDGYLWPGTREGLARFDGIDFTTLKLTEDLVQPKVIRLKATGDGSLWVTEQPHFCHNDFI